MLNQLMMNEQASILAVLLQLLVSFSSSLSKAHSRTFPQPFFLTVKKELGMQGKDSSKKLQQ